MSNNMNITYRLGERMYLNITNRCTNRCLFCIRNTVDDGLGVDLWLPQEPDAAEVIQAIQSAEGFPEFPEIVFCGYGEPLLRPDVVTEVARFLKERNLKVRLNTNGQANLIHGRNVVSEFAPYVEAVSISLNAQDADTYTELCRPIGGKDAYQAVLEFAVECQRVIPRVTLTIVDWPGIDAQLCRQKAQSLGADFRVRSLTGKFENR